MRERPHIRIYTDGGADPNPGPGGWGAILIHPGRTRELSGGHPATTNNRMELSAAIEALSALTQPCEIDFYTDSEYLRRGITEWLDKWVASGRLAAGKVLNDDLWLQLYDLVQAHTIRWHWVKGHAGDPYNERADELASAAIPREALQLAQDRTRVLLRIGGAGGNFCYAAAVSRGEDREVLSGSLQNTTPNHFSILAAIALIEALDPAEPLQFLTNNSFLFEGITKWIHGWKKRGFKKFEPDWRRLDALNAERDILWTIFKKDDTPPEFESLGESIKANCPDDFG